MTMSCPDHARIVFTEEVWTSNFRQYGKMKSREEKQSQKKLESLATRYTREMFGKLRIVVFSQ